MCKQRSPDFEGCLNSGLDYLNSLVSLRLKQDDSVNTPEEKEKPLVFAWIVSNLCLKYVANVRKDSVTLGIRIPQQSNWNTPYLDTHGSFYTLKYISTNEQLYALLSSFKASTKGVLEFEESTEESNIVSVKITFKVPIDAES